MVTTQAVKSLRGPSPERKIIVFWCLNFSLSTVLTLIIADTDIHHHRTSKIYMKLSVGARL